MKMVKRTLQVIIILVSISIIAIGFMGYQQYKDVVGEMPLKEKVAQIQNKADYVTYEYIRKDLLDATIAIEDHRFYQHHGIDYIGVARAFITNLYRNDILGGGSTITQQLAKNMYFSYDPSIIRKVSEFFVAREIENHYSKEEILELYVNIINYGDQNVGIYQASMGYFKVMPVQLTLDQASLLAGLPQSPSNYQLSNHLREAQVRQKQVLDAMVREEMIAQEQLNEIIR